MAVDSGGSFTLETMYDVTGGTTVNGHAVFNGPAGNLGSLSVGGTATFNDSVGNTPTLSVSGTADFNGALGTVTDLSVSGTVDFNGALGTVTDLSVSGTARFNAGLPSLNTLTVSSWGEGHLTISGDTSVSGPVNWGGGTMSGAGTTYANGGVNVSGPYTKRLDARTLNNPATATWNGWGDIYGHNGAVINNGVAAVFDVQDDGDLLNGAGDTPTFNNAGTFKKSGGAGTTDVRWIFNNTGAVQAQSGTLRFIGPFMQTAGITIVEVGGILDATNFSADKVVNNGTIVSSGNMTIGDPATYNGYSGDGKMDAGGHTITLNCAGFVSLGYLTTATGGTLNAPNGIALGTGENLVGSGIVNAKVAAGFGSTIDATGGLALGDSSSYVGFFSDGELYVGSHAVTLHDKNEVVLGSLTEIDGGGTLTAANGFLLENGKNLIAAGGGNVSKGGGPDNSRFLNRGYVEGPNPSSSDWLIFDLFFKASTGQTAGNLGFLGGYGPGDSPGWETHNGNLMLGGTSPFEMGGDTPGDGDGFHSRLDVTGNLTFAPGAIIEILPWGGYVPEIGRQFTILTWGDAPAGSAEIDDDDPWWVDHGIAFTPDWQSDRLVLTAVPEPATLSLLALGGLVLLRRKRR